MVPTLSAGWNVFLLIAVAACAVLFTINIRKENKMRKEAQQEQEESQDESK